MRRFLIVFVSLAALLGLTSSALADSTVVVKTFFIDNSTRSGVGFDVTPCGGTPVNESSTNRWYWDITNGATTALDPNLAGVTRSWTVQLPAAPTQTDAYGIQVYPSNAAALSTFKIDVNGSNSGQASIYYYASSTDLWAGKAAITAPGTGWVTADASNLTYTWYHYDQNGNLLSTPAGQPVTATAAQFETAHGIPADGYGAEISFGCDNKSFSFQNLRYGATGSVTTLNFSSLTDRLMIGRSTSKTIAGTAVRISGGSKYGSAASVMLQARPATSSTWSNVSTVPVGNGSCTVSACWAPFSKLVSPKVTTFYRWVEGATVETDPAISASTEVTVATRITASWPTVYHNRTFGVSGSTYPAKPHSIVTLWGKHGTSTYVLGHATVGSTGTFRVYGTVHTIGSWSFWITVPAASGDLAGKSAVHSAYAH